MKAVNIKKNIKNLSIIAISSVLSTQFAFGKNLPDDLNYPKAEQSYLEAKKKSDSLREQANAEYNTVKPTLDNIDNRTQSLINEKSDNQTKLNQIINVPGELRRRIQDKKDDILSLENDIHQNRRTIEDLRSELDRTQNDRELNRIRREYEKLHRDNSQDLDELAKMKKALDRLSIEMSNLESNLKDKTNQLTSTNSSLVTTQNSLEQKQQKKNTLEESKNNLQTRINNASQNKATLESDISKLKQEIKTSLEQIQQRVDRAEGNFKVVEARLQNAKKTYEPFFKEVNDLKSKIELNTVKQKQTHDKLIQATNRVSELRGQHSKLTIEYRKNNNPATKAELDKVTVALNKEIAVYNSAQAENTRLLTELNVNRRDLANAEARVKPQIETLNTIQRDYDTQKANLDQLKTALERQNNSPNIVQKRNLINAKNQELAAVNNTLQNGPNELARLNQEINSINSEIPKLQAKVEILNENLNKLTAEMDPIVDKLSQIKPAYEAEKSRYDALYRRTEPDRIRLEQMYRRIVEQDRKIEQLSKRIERLRDDNYNRELRVADNEKEIQELELSIGSYNDSIEYLTNRNEIIDREVANLDIQREQTLRRYHQIDESAQLAEVETQRRQDFMIEVSKKYDLLVVSAREAGRSQGLDKARNNHVAIVSEAEKEGQLAGKSAGNEVGLSNGRTYWTQYGKYQGFEDGKKQGTEAGLKEPANQEQGRKLGIEAGKRIALEEAQSSYFEGRKELKEKLLKSHLAQSVNIDLANFQLGQERARGAEGIIDPNLNGIIRIEVGDSQLVDENNKPDNFSAEEACNKIVESPIQYKEINTGLGKCEFEFVEINQACQQEFKQAYIEEYTEIFSPKYKSEKKTECLVSYKNAFDADKTKSYDSAYALSYKTTFAKYKEVGAAQAQKQSFEAAKNEYLRDNLDAVKAQRKNDGIKDEQTKFTTQSVGDLRNLSIRKTSGDDSTLIFAGNTLALDGELLNFGQISMKDGETLLKVVSLSNDIATSSNQQLIKIPLLSGQTKGILTNIAKLQVSPSATPGVAQVKVIALYKNGETQEQIINIEIRASVKLEIATIVNKSGSLKINEYSQWKVYFKNVSEYSPNQDITVEVSALNSSDEKFIKYKSKTSQVSANSLRAGQKSDDEANLNFAFTNNRAIGKTIPMKITAKYMNAEIFSTVINVDVKEECNDVVCF